MQVGPGIGSAVSTGTTIHLTFSYHALEKSVPPVLETHTVTLDIDCYFGGTTGTLSE